MMASGGRTTGRNNARHTYGHRIDIEHRGDSLSSISHEVAIDHQKRPFDAANDMVEKMRRRPPTTLEEFLNKHRAA